MSGIRRVSQTLRRDDRASARLNIPATTMDSMFSLPLELLLATITTRFPCRDLQIRNLATLLSVPMLMPHPSEPIANKNQIRGANTRNLVLHGLEATGKSAIIKALLEQLSKPPDQRQTNGNKKHPEDSLQYTIVKSAECISGRHLLEQTVGAVAEAVEWKDHVGRCENLVQLAIELGRLLAGWAATEEDGIRRRFVLVFDGIDRQRDGPPTLLPALARLGEIVSPFHNPDN